ncbi:hypothetical protein NKG05_11085 [Oerskovia sp. M15]
MTLVLVNTKQRPDKGKSDALCWFRPVLRVHAQDGALTDRSPGTCRSTATLTSSAATSSTVPSVI